MIHRRTFLKQSGLALAATTLLPGTIFANSGNQPLGLQLYSLRETIGNNVKGTIEKLAEIGFKEVETYGYSKDNGFFGLSVQEFKEILTQNGINTPSGHYGMDPFLEEKGTKDDVNYILDVAKQLDQKYVIIPYIAEGLRSSIDDYKRIAEKLNTAGRMCKDAGLKLVYHNHAFEFDNYNGKNGYDIFLENTDEDLVDFEMDIYWVVRAGIEPSELFNKYPGRFPLWHVKDMHKQKPELNTEIGSGSVDYKEIFKYTEEAGVKHLIIEQENFEMDPYKSLEQSFDYLQNKLVTKM
ncbi:TIM barrel protein [Salegentibacter sp. F188]|uniref:TIM barrel protein n=1 Tax=Autumnicola patrickiae TaxID=3075591 RepID=A0ABU3E4D1_9FLAO|nr:TIM barrel protein [Salegentibacter sp. F188]MDT0690834.1 TIM barrel protein [Salegentibacter sp. F188]